MAAVTAVINGLYIWRWKLLFNLLHRFILNRFSHLILNLFCGVKERDSIYTLFICTDWREKESPILIWKPLQFYQS